MTTDLTMLAWTAAFTAVLWLPYISAHILNVGLMEAVTYRADDVSRTAWAERAKKAHYNAVENLAPFAALVIVAHLTGAANAATAAAAITYFGARVAHYVLYTAGVPFGRTICFAVSWAAMACIFWQIVTKAG
jgi:uncharacterized MAPEG superfamily protein